MNNSIKDAIYWTLQSGFEVVSPETNLRMFKEAGIYYIIDGKETTEYGNWESAYSYFISCHLVAISHTEEE